MADTKTDHELIAAVAYRLGWTRLQVRHHIGDTPVMWAVKKGHNPEDLEAIPPDWTTSVDAALGLLDKDCRVEVLYNPWQKRWTVGYTATPFSLEDELVTGSDLSYPRAILLAFLESQEEKP